MLVLNEMLLNSDMQQPFSKQEVTQQTILYMHLVAKADTSTFSVTLWPGWKLFDCVM